jgi:hypothetical protein
MSQKFPNFYAMCIEKTGKVTSFSVNSLNSGNVSMSVLMKQCTIADGNYFTREHVHELDIFEISLLI